MDAEDASTPGDDGSIGEDSMVSHDGASSGTGSSKPGSNKVNDELSFIRTLVASRLCCILMVLIAGAVAGTVTYLVTSKNYDDDVQEQVCRRGICLLFGVSFRCGDGEEHIK